MSTLTHEMVYGFLRHHYKHERFEGRGIAYADEVAAVALEQIQTSGQSCISRHESANGRVQWYNSRLVCFPGEAVSYDRSLGKFLLPA